MESRTPNLPRTIIEWLASLHVKRAPGNASHCWVSGNASPQGNVQPGMLMQQATEAAMSIAKFIRAVRSLSRSEKLQIAQMLLGDLAKEKLRG